MRDRRSQTADTVQTLAVAALVVAAVVGTGYAIQRLVLRSPSNGELVAARIEGALLRYRYLTSVVHVEGEPARRAECLEGWEPGRHGRPGGRGARVLFSDGERLILGARRVVRLTPGSRASRLPPTTEVKLAGCARSLTNHIYARLVTPHTRSRAVLRSFHRRPALILRARTKRDRFVIYVDPESLLPFAIFVKAPRASAWSSLKPVRLTPERKRSFRARFDG
jgi:hypothetical protein